MPWRARPKAGSTMAGVVNKFFITSLIMWAAPVAILYAFNHSLIPGVTDMSPHSMTLVSGFVAVISVNVVIAFYICLAMREPSDKHEPDPKFLAEAKASIKQLGKNQDGDSSETRSKQE
ncbi:uncharacterized protein LOC107832453 isoform X1 [Nicotiana tabacum]|uniref:Vacuolar ATPase assembly integral membrane protein VMA21 homolog n=2 Tax=Nicotiana tabacum TaxID=4097 RepID=A0A1S4DRM8_TOBAC|nr:PREDICTED: uncharacterized protein LOC107832453 isoform X1 [Nicotiana tabacum]